MPVVSLFAAREAYKPFSYPWAYDAWLAQQQMHWLPSEVSLASDVEDWRSRLTDGERNLLTQIFRFFTQADCFRGDTEILTPDGWVEFRNLRRGCRVAQVHDDGSVEFVLPTFNVEKPYDGDMVNFRAQRKYVNFTVTSGHRIPYKWQGEWKIETAAEVKLYQNKKLMVAGAGTGPRKSLTPMERLAIAHQADGNTKLDNNGSRLGGIKHRFSFKKRRKIERLRGILINAGMEFDEVEKSAPNGLCTLFSVVLPDRLDKNFDWVKLDEVSAEWCKEFVDELSHWDSHIADGLIYYSNTRQRAADKVQAIASLAGYGNGMSVATDCRKDNHNDIYRVVIGHPQWMDCQHVEKTVSNYKGMVYCVTVPTGKILIRDNGCVVVSGNCDVAGAYLHQYMPVFRAPELAMMMTAFANAETIHIAAYSHLLDTIGMPEVEYEAFLHYGQMREKHEYYQTFRGDSPRALARTIAAFAAFTEGLQLFASFAILLNFPRQGKMKGMGQIIAWSSRDETAHVEGMVKLWHTLIADHPGLLDDTLRRDVLAICERMVKLEDAFIDLAFELGGVQGLQAAEVKTYIRWLADTRLGQLGFPAHYGISANPLPWVDELLMLPEHANFFETRATEYGRAASQGSWGDVWGGAGITEGLT